MAILPRELWIMIFKINRRERYEKAKNYLESNLEYPCIENFFGTDIIVFPSMKSRNVYYLDENRHAIYGGRSGYELII